MSLTSTAGVPPSPSRTEFADVRGDLDGGRYSLEGEEVVVEIEAVDRFQLAKDEVRADGNVNPRGPASPAKFGVFVLFGTGGVELVKDGLGSTNDRRIPPKNAENPPPEEFALDEEGAVDAADGVAGAAATAVESGRNPLGD